MDVTCSKCGTLSNVPDQKVPIGRSYLLCPQCEARINIFKSLQPGAVVTNLTGLRFSREGSGLHEEYCEPGELWRLVEVIHPCPEKGRARECERDNKGRCPNQRLILRLRRDKTLYRSCMYRKGRKIFDKSSRSPVGAGPPPSDILPPEDEDKTYRIT